MLITPSSGLLSKYANNTPTLYCDECGDGIRNTGIWNEPRYVCGNYDCPKCPFKREVINTSFPILGH